MKKLFLLIFGLNLLTLFINCGDCPPERYYDYKGIEITHYENYIPKDKYLSMRVDYLDIYYLAQNFRFDFGSSLYATSVCEKGYDGAKYLLEEINIYSNSPFDDNHPAGTKLNDIFQVYGTNSEGKYGLGYLKDFSITKVNEGFFFLKTRPIINKTHIFTIEFKKSNGEIVSIFIATDHEIKFLYFDNSSDLLFAGTLRYMNVNKI